MTSGTAPGALRSNLIRYWPLLPIGAVSGAAVAAGTYWALGLTGVVVVLCLVHIWRITSTELLVMTMPLTFYANAGPVVLNVTVSDFLLGFVIVRLLLDPEIPAVLSTVSATLKKVVGVMLALLFACGATIFVRSILDPHTDLVAFVSDAFKLAIVFIYFLVCLVAFVKMGRDGDTRLLSLWAVTAAAIGALGTLGSILYPLGIDLGLTFDFRATSTFEDPNAFVTYLLLSMPISMVARHVRGRSLFSWHLVPMLAGVIASYSRGALLALAVMVLSLVALSFGDALLRRFRLIAVVLAAAVGYLIISGTVERFFEASRGVSFEDDIRFQLWRAAWDLWTSSPLFGVGLGQFIESTYGMVDHSAEGVLAHNTFLSVLSETGLAGVALFSVVPILVIVGLFRNGSTVARLLGCSLIGAMAMAFSLNLQNFRSIWVLLALALAWTIIGEGRPTKSAPVDAGTTTGALR